MADQGKPQGILTTKPAQLQTIKVVAIDSTALDPKDKQILCSAICYCNYNPNKGKKQNNLYQSCVSERLKEMDEMMFNQSPYKPEITYDMHTDPPEPIMDKNILTKGHKYVWGWKTFFKKKLVKIRVMNMRKDRAINYEWFNSIKEEEVLNSELPMNWFIGYDYGTGVVIQAGTLPLMGSVESDPLPAPYVLLNRVLKPLRVEKIGDLHRGNYSTDEIPLIKGYLANHWLARFDIEDDQKLEYFAKLQDEPKLNRRINHMHFKKEQDYKAWVATQEKGAIGGGLLTPQGGEDYVGAIPAIRAVLYFKEGYSDEMREAIAQCFDDYQEYAKAHLTWLWQDEPPNGAGGASLAFEKVKPIRNILKLYSPMKAFNFLYISGKEKFATGAWEFFVNGRSQWQAQKKNYQSTLTFSMPIDWVGENSKAFIELFIKCAQRLKAKHGYAGYACIISQIRSDKNEPN
ncbi:hypothetical protein FQR65_LT16581 [Abscondita terminalis]|nr:hypothetical protein FQR65_LT16581 [Abscondita terminalis]